MTTQLLTLLLGAIGALGAIFLKEATQLAIQRRTIAWQLFGQLWTIKTAASRVPGVQAALDKVKEQEEDLAVAYTEGAAVFKKRYTEHSGMRTELRKLIRTEVMEHLRSKPVVTATTREVNKASLQVLTDSRVYLMEGKSFITDRDAAILGLQAALHVTRFRSAWSAVLYGMAVLINIQLNEEAETDSDVQRLIENTVQSGEDMLVAMVHLERISEAITSRPLLSLVRETLFSK